MKIYKSKLGKGILTLVLVLLILPILLILFQKEWIGSVVAGLICIGVLLFYFFLYSRTKYVINGDQLIVHNGGLSKIVINIDEILSIDEVINYISAPAFSTHRLKIKYDNGKIIYISPLKMEQFIADMQEKNPLIVAVLR